MKITPLKLITTAKIAWITLCAAFISLVLFVPVTMAALLSSTGNLAFSLSKLWAHFMLWATGVKVTVRNRDRIRKGRPYIIISNHQSDYDILAIVTTLQIQFRWIIKKELLKAPLFGYALYASRNIFIDRSDNKKAIESIHRGMDCLRRSKNRQEYRDKNRQVHGMCAGMRSGGCLNPH